MGGIGVRLTAGEACSVYVRVYDQLGFDTGECPFEFAFLLA